MDWSSIVGGGASLLGGIASSIFSSSAQKRQIKAQQQENQKNRDFNAAQASLSRTYNTQMVREARAYDSPTAMMQRLKDAGLNPNLVYGDIGSGASVTVGNTGQAASASGGVGTALPDYSGLLQGIRQAADISLIKAQTENVRADTEKKESETQLNGKALEYYDELQKSNIANINADTSLKVTQKDVGEEEKKNLAKSTEVLGKSIEQMEIATDKMYQEIKNLEIDEQIKRVESFFKSSEYEATIKSILASANKDNAAAHLDYTQANDLVQTLWYRQMALQEQANEASASAWLKRAQRTSERLNSQFLQVTLDGAKIDLDVKQSTAHAAAWIDIGAQALGSLAGAFLGFGTGAKAFGIVGKGAKAVGGFGR